MIDATLAALADPRRRQVVELLGQGPQRAGALATATGLSPAALTRHLRALREGGLASERRDPADGRARLYQLNREPFAELRGWLDDVEASWGSQLAVHQPSAPSPVQWPLTEAP